MTDTDEPLRLVRRLAMSSAVLMLLTTLLSAYIRHSQAGLGCEDWPACYGQGLRALQQRLGDLEPTSAGIAAARLAHRLVASLALIIVIAMVVSTWARRQAHRRESVLAVVLLVLALALAVLGIATPGARLPAVAVGNLLGGFVMLALCWRLAAPADACLGGLAWAGLALLTCQIALGALVSASFAGLACTGLADCLRAAQATAWDWQVLNPWREPVFDALQPVHKAGALTQSVHRLGAMLVLPVLALLGVVTWRRGRRRQALALLLLTGAQGALGLLAVGSGLPLALVLLHNLGAALLLATLARLV